jgi:hypothetical protein
MNLTRNRNRETKHKGLEFPLLECWNPMTESAQIVAQIDGRRVMCNIPLKLLHKRFGDADGPVALVKQNRPAIETAADNVIESGRFESDGSIVLDNNDF